MSVDPTDPTTFGDHPTEDEPGTGSEEPEETREANEADAAEQQTELVEHRDSPLSDRSLDDANPADAAEQARVVELNEDEYR